MRKYTVKEELDSYRSIQRIDFSGAERVKDEIFELARKNFDAWEERASYIEDEVIAYKYLAEFCDNEIPEHVVLEFKKSAIKDNEDYYAQQEYFKRQVSEYKYQQKVKREIDPIKDLLIELESIIGNECYNSNIQNYRTWEWEGEGRSFRYPVTFHGEDDTYKRKMLIQRLKVMN